MYPSSKRPEPGPVLHCPMERLLDKPKSRRPSWRRPMELPWRQPSLKIAMADCQQLELHSGVAEREARSAVQRAIATWNRVGLPIRLELIDGEPTAGGLPPDVLVGWYTAPSDPESMFVGGIHAHADYPPGNTLFGGPPLPLHFNASVLWGIEEAGCYDIETIALHELAHLLGLIYHSGPSTILYDAIPPAPLGIRHDLDAETQQRAGQLYGGTPIL